MATLPDLAVKHGGGTVLLLVLPVSLLFMLPVTDTEAAKGVAELDASEDTV